jgi:hypothetical protein
MNYCTNFLLVCISAVAASGCAGVSSDVMPGRTDHIACHSPSRPVYATEDESPTVVIGNVPLSASAAETARLIHVLPLIADWHEAAGKEDGYRTLTLRQAVLERIMLAGLEVSSVMAELDCEGERSDQLRDRLQRAETERVRRLTLTGVLIGAFTAASSGILSLASHSGGADVAAIVGGTAEAGVGLSALEDRGAGTLSHGRNLLAEIWNQSGASTAFPPSIWRYLNARFGGGESPRDSLREQWNVPERLGTPGSSEEERRIRLFFGEGGVYTIDDLRAREAMLDLVEARVALFNKDIAALLRELVALEAWSGMKR